MVFNDKLQIFIEEKVPDGYGGFESTEIEVATLRCKVAPYRVQSGDVFVVPNPTASVKFFVPNLPFDEDELFVVVHNGKRYRKLGVTDYKKVVMIIAERI